MFIEPDEPENPKTTVPVSKKLVIINSASSVAAYLLNTSVLIWLQPYLLGRVSIDEYALYPVVVAPLVFVPLLSAVLTGGLGRFGVEAYAKGDQRRVSEIVSTMAPLLAAAGAAVMGLGTLFAFHAEKFLEISPELVDDARLMLIILVAAAALRVALSPFEIGLFIRQKFVLLNSIQVSSQVLRFALLMTLLFGVSSRVLWVVVASASADVLSLVTTVILSRRYVPALRFRPRGIRWGCAPELISFGGWTFLMQAAATLKQGVIPILLNKISTALQISCFYIGTLPMQQIQYMTYLAMQPLLPALVAMHAKGDRVGLAQAYLRGGRFGLWFVTFVTLPLIIFRREIFVLYVGPDMLDAAVVMALLLAMLPFHYSNVMLGHLAMATGEIRRFSLQVLVNQALSLALSILLVWWAGMGAVGAALGASIVLTLVQPLVMWRMGWRMARVSCGEWWRVTVLPGIIPALVAIPGWLGMKMAFSPGSWSGLALAGTPGAVLFIAGLLLFSLKPVDRSDLGKILARFS